MRPSIRRWRTGYWAASTAFFSSLLAGVAIAVMTEANEFNAEFFAGAFVGFLSLLIAGIRFGHYVQLDDRLGCITFSRFGRRSTVALSQVHRLLVPDTPAGLPHPVVIEMATGDRIDCPLVHGGFFVPSQRLRELRSALSDLGLEIDDEPLPPAPPMRWLLSRVAGGG